MPANRFGSYQFTAAQLKIIQEIITLLVFPVFSVLYLGDKFKWNYGVGFGFIVGAAFFIFHKWQAEQAQGTLPLRGLACTSKIDSFTCFFFADGLLLVPGSDGHFFTGNRGHTQHASPLSR